MKLQDSIQLQLIQSKKNKTSRHASFRDYFIKMLKSVWKRVSIAGIIV